MASAYSRGGASRVALVGDETLLGREVRDVLEIRAKNVAITPYAASGEGNFGEQEGEAVYLEPLEAHSLTNEQAIILAGSPEGALKAYRLAREAGGRPVLIDCTRNLDNESEARIVAPLLGEPELGANWLFVVAHPAATALATVLQRLARHKRIDRAIAHVFEPASERGKRGLSELHQQTNALLAFKPLEKEVFDAQLSFNLLPQYGEHAPKPLAAIEQQIEKHLATLLSGNVMPSLRLVQAPVFHGYSISLWIEFDAAVKAEALGEALASAQIEVRPQSEEAPHNVGVASQSGLVAGDIRVDHNNPRAAWLWIVADNLRLSADAAVDLVTALGAERR